MQKAHKDKETKRLPPRVIAVSSGKGGVGKSSISVNLGISLARGGARVCLLDADTGLANANILLGLTPHFSLEHVLYGAKPIEDVMLDGPHGLKIVPGAHGISECVSLHPRQQLRLTRELARIEHDFDYILIDTAAGISDTTLDFVSAAHHTLIVITPEPTSLTDAFSLIKLLKRRRNTIHYHVVVNMCSNGVQAREVFHRFRSAVEKYIGVEAHYLGYILRDESMRAAVVLQNPVAMFPDTDPSCRGFIKLADSLEAATASDPVRSSFSAYWHRQFREQRNQAGDGRQQSVQPVADPAPGHTRESDYLSELRSRLLLLIEQGHVDEAEVGEVLKESVETYVKRFERSPLDVLALVDRLVHSPDRDDQLMREIAERVKPWGNFSLVPPVDELADSELNLVARPSESQGPRPSPPEDDEPALDEDINDAEKDDSMPVTPPQKTPIISPGTRHVRKSAAIEDCLHHYDVDKFGSQESLLDLLKRSDPRRQTLAEFLDSLV